MRFFCFDNNMYGEGWRRVEEGGEGRVEKVLEGSWVAPPEFTEKNFNSYIRVTTLYFKPRNQQKKLQPLQVRLSAVDCRPHGVWIRVYPRGFFKMRSDVMFF